jgi:4-amino-4-deoxy-L-arabinose transferase-like glycosyltransferase
MPPPRIQLKRRPVPLAVLPVAAIALGVVAIELALAGRYGYHRDELYFLACGRRLAFGYVDQPPLTPLIGRVATTLFGDTTTAIRVFPALSLGAMVVLAAMIAREFGGRRFAQVLAALAVAVTGEYLGAGHLLSPTPFDQLLWVALGWIVIRIVRTGEPRLWLAAGAIAGVGLENKWTIAFFCAALAVGFALTEQRRWFRSPWLWAGALLAVAVWAPNLAWQADHGWPVYALDRNLHHEAIEDGNLYTFVPAQILYVGPLLLPIWIAGLVWLWRNPAGRPYRAFAIAYGLLFAFFLATLGKPYYIGPIYGILLPAGAVATEAWLARRRGWLTQRKVLVAVLIAGVLPLPIALPILPAHTLHSVPLQDVNYDLGETIGWPRMVDEIARADRSLPPRERRTAVVLTSNYGEAGAIDRYGPAVGLPGAYSGHNNYWLWGPPPERRTAAILVGFGRPYLRTRFAGLRRTGTLRNGEGVNNDEQGLPIFTARTIRGTWAGQWRHLRHYN